MLLLGNRNDVGLELAHASSHLSILSVCSYGNDVARKMHTRLQVVFNDVKNLLESPTRIDHSQGTTWDVRDNGSQHFGTLMIKVASEIQQVLTESVGL